MESIGNANKIGNRIVITPKLGIYSVSLKKELISSLKDSLFKCDTSSLPSNFKISGKCTSTTIMLDKCESVGEFTTDLLITHPGSSEVTGISQKTVLAMHGQIQYIPELRMETVTSSDRNKEKGHEKSLDV